MSTSTLFVALIVVSATMAVSIAVVAVRHSLSLTLWAGAFGAYSLAFLLVALRGQISDVFSVVVANVGLTTGFALFIKGIWRFQKRNPHGLLVWLPIPLVAVLFFLYLDNLIVRFLLINAMAALQGMYSFFALWQNRRQTAGRGQFVAMTGFLVLTGTFVSRVVSATVGPVDSILTNSALQAATLLSGIASLLLIGTGFASMVHERVQHELDEHRETLKQQHVTLQQVAADLQAANSKLTELSLTDSLTGLANRRQFDEMLEKSWARARRSAKPLALFMVDVDFFKLYNDRYGHQAGDQCLKRVAAVLQSNLRRPDDLAARYGGEEFAVIATDLDREKAEEFAHHLCNAVAALAIPHANSRYAAITVSIGVASIAPADADNGSAAVNLADAALYRAKEEGRNCVRMAQ